MTTVSRDVVRAVLEVRDHRHNETHAALLALWQALAAELIDAGAIRPDGLAHRLRSAEKVHARSLHGEAARDLIGHALRWLDAIEPELPSPLPTHWVAPRPPVNGLDAMGGEID